MVKLKKFPVIKNTIALLPSGKHTLQDFPDALFNDKHYLTFSDKLNKWVGTININFNNNIDRSVSLALNVIEQVKGVPTDALLICSYSRGPTQLWEKHYDNFKSSGRVSPRTSPNTTLAVLSNALSEQLNIRLPSFVVSATCVGGTMAILNAIALMNIYNKPSIVVGAEAPITPFTVEQIKSIRIYSNANKYEGYPSKPLSMDKNSFVLSEGAVYLELENKGELTEGDIYIAGIGYFRETSGTITSISKRAYTKAFTEAVNGEIPDVVITHAPGTLLGDKLEYDVVKGMFPTSAISNIKWKIGHNYAVSGLSNLFLGAVMLKYGSFLPIPYIKYSRIPNKISSVLVNSAGFGGHCLSVYLKKS